MKCLLLPLLFCSLYSLGQLEVFPTNPLYMESGALFGPNYTVYDAEFHGSYVACAQFKGNNSDLGLEGGFVITTGQPATFPFGVHGPNNYPDAAYDLQANALYPALEPILGASGFDGSYVTFTFVPAVDTLVFNYSFGSEEYNEYVGSTFQDAPGIFVVGPGIVGEQNIAKINGQDVSVNSVHGQVSNPFGSQPSENGANYFDNTVPSTNATIEFDGFTINTEARLDGLLVGAEYQMTIAIADAGDGIYDSGLFIEACESCQAVVGKSELDLGMALELTPNPVEDVLTLSSSGDHIYRIFGVSGKEISSGEFNDTVQLQLADLSAGTYLVILDDGTTSRFIKK